MNPNKILVPIDFSDYSDAVLDYAVEMAVNATASLYILHAVPSTNFYDWNLTGMYPLLGEDMFESAKENAQKQLEVLANRLQATHPNLIIITLIDVLNNPFDAIIQEATQSAIDLIIMGSHGRRGLNHLLMGSVAEMVMRNAPCDLIIYKKHITPTSK